MPPVSDLRRSTARFEIEPIVADVSSSNIRGILDDVDLVIDAADNFLIRFLLNDWSLSTATPWVHGGCVGASGQVRLFTRRRLSLFSLPGSGTAAGRRRRNL